MRERELGTGHLGQVTGRSQRHLAIGLVEGTDVGASAEHERDQTVQTRDQNARAGLRFFRAEAGEATDDLAPQLQPGHLGVQRILGAQRLPVEGVLEHQPVQRRSRHAELHEGFGQVGQAAALREGRVQPLGQALVAALHHHEEQPVERAEVVVDVTCGAAEQRADAARRQLRARQTAALERLDDLADGVLGAGHNVVMDPSVTLLWTGVKRAVEEG